MNTPIRYTSLTVKYEEGQEEATYTKLCAILAEDKISAMIERHPTQPKMTLWATEKHVGFERFVALVKGAKEAAKEETI